MATALTHNMDLSDRPTGRLCFSAVTKNKTIGLYTKKKLLLFLI